MLDLSALSRVDCTTRGSLLKSLRPFVEAFPCRRSDINKFNRECKDAYKHVS